MYTFISECRGDQAPREVRLKDVRIRIGELYNFVLGIGQPTNFGLESNRVVNQEGLVDVIFRALAANFHSDSWTSNSGPNQIN
jgi:hypothetical protein